MQPLLSLPSLPSSLFYFIRIITGQHLSGKFYYHQALIVSRVEPPTGPTSGGTAVAIHGRFEHLAEIRCRFGRGSTALSVARVVDGSRIECTSAPQAAMGYGAQVKYEEEPHARTFGAAQTRRFFISRPQPALRGPCMHFLHLHAFLLHAALLPPLSLPSPLSPPPHPSPLTPHPPLTLFIPTRPSNLPPTASSTATRSPPSTTRRWASPPYCQHGSSRRVRDH